MGKALPGVALSRDWRQEGLSLRVLLSLGTAEVQS